MDYKAEMWFDSNGQTLAVNFNPWGYSQAKQFQRYLDVCEDPTRGILRPYTS